MDTINQPVQSKAGKLLFIILLLLLLLLLLGRVALVRGVAGYSHQTFP